VHHLRHDHGVLVDDGTTSKAYIRRNRLQDAAAYSVM